MPRSVIKFATPVGDRYLVWSSIVDAPITFGMELDDLLDWLRAQTDKEWVERFVETRLPRVEKFGCSNGETTAQMVDFNRAGAGGTVLTLEQIVDFFCVRQGQGEQPVGRPTGEEN